jgi:hypothetical protein
MKRRTVLKNLLIAAAGTAILPAACRSKPSSNAAYKSLQITKANEDVLVALCEAILPKTKDFVGATDLKTKEFILNMVNDCAAPEDQKKFTEGLVAFDKLAHDKFGQLFQSYTAAQKKELLASLEANKNMPEAAYNFYKTVKGYTIQNFTGSKDFMLTIKNYKMVPGSDFKGKVKIV